MNQYRVVYVEPEKPAVEKKIGTKLEDLQAEVGGLIECIYCHRDGTLIVANDEAKLLGMEATAGWTVVPSLRGHFSSLATRGRTSAR